MISAQELKDLSATLRSSSAELVAIGLLKEAGFSEDGARKEVYKDALVKEACFSLTQKGIDYDRAVSMVKSATLDEAMLAKATAKKIEEVAADTLEKAAEYISELEGRLSAIEVQEKTPEITKIAGATPLSYEDLAALQALPKDTLSKVASAVEEPWSMGKVASTGAGVGKSDPLLDFLLS